MSKEVIFKIIDDVEGGPKTPTHGGFYYSGVNPTIDSVLIPNIMEKAAEKNISFEDAYIAILAHMAKDQLSEIDLDISVIEDSIIRCDCCRQFIENPVHINLPMGTMNVCTTCASKIENYVNSISKRNDYLSDEDICKIFESWVGDVCKENDIKVCEKTHVDPIYNVYDFYYIGHCIYTYKLHKSGLSISEYESSRIATALVNNIQGLEKRYQKLSYEDICKIFLVPVAFICGISGVEVYEKHGFATMRHFEFRLGEKWIHTFKICKSSSQISHQTSERLANALIEKINKKREE